MRLSSSIAHVGCLLFTGLLLGACDEISNFVESKYQKGTHKGVQLCVERNKTDVLSLEATRDACTRKHQKKIDYMAATGRGSITREYGGNRVIFDGYAENISDNSVITHIEIVVHYYDNDGRKYTRRASINKLWIEPSAKAKIEEFFKFVEWPKGSQFKTNPRWCSELREAKKPLKNCKAFDFDEIRGVTISTS
tara:strand:- start:1711 stop:2292 length:582 start_codon:yes stop_codon:yes gene_type:complete